MNKKSFGISLFLVLTMAVVSACSPSGLSIPGLSEDIENAIPNAGEAVEKIVEQVVEQPSEPAASVPQVSGATPDIIAAYQGALQDIYSEVNPSVVNIQVTSKMDPTDLNMPEIPGFPFFNMPPGNENNGNGDNPEQYQRGLGSGFVWDQNGHIVTNNHVVRGAEKIEVTFSDGSILPATLVGTDPDSDLAVVKVEAPANTLKPVQMAGDAPVNVGQLAIAIGNPYGLEGSMTAGIVSAVGRSLPADFTSSRSYTIPEVIQTDAPINPGNSGGVLVDAQGQVIGVTSAIESSSGANAGIGFAIPASIVNNVVPTLIQDGKYIHPWLGISGTSLIPDLAKAMDLDAGQRGALVNEVFPESPAEKAGLRGSTEEITIEGQTANVGGDVITAIDSQAVTDMEDLIAYLGSSTEVGQKVELSFLRDGKPQKVSVTLAARPSSDEQSSSESKPVQRGVTLGITGMTVDESIAQEMDLADGQKGVLVLEVNTDSLADTAGLRGGNETATINGEQVKIGGDIITALNGQAINSIEELKAGLGQLTSDQELALTILRDGTELEIAINPGE